MLAIAMRPGLWGDDTMDTPVFHFTKTRGMVPSERAWTPDGEDDDTHEARAGGTDARRHGGDTVPDGACSRGRHHQDRLHHELFGFPGAGRRFHGQGGQPLSEDSREGFAAGRPDRAYQARR